MSMMGPTAYPRTLPSDWYEIVYDRDGPAPMMFGTFDTLEEAEKIVATSTGPWIIIKVNRQVVKRGGPAARVKVASQRVRINK